MSSLLYIMPIAIIIWFILYKLKQTKLMQQSPPNIDLDEAEQVYEANYHEEELRQKVKAYYENDPISPSHDALEQSLEVYFIHEKMKYRRRHKLDGRNCYKHHGVAKVSSFTLDDYLKMLYVVKEKVLKEFTLQV